MTSLQPLRDYQARAYAQLQAAARRWSAVKPGYGLLAVAPTGTGKTRIGLELATRGVAKGKQTLWLAPRTELIDQPVAHLAAAGWTDVQIVQADRTRGTGPIIIASIQTLLARGERPPAALIVLDEARHYVSPEWGQVAQDYLGAVRVGLDATPARADGTALGALFDELVDVASIAELTSAGWLVPARVIAPDAYQRALAEDPCTAYLRHTPQGRALVFCRSRQHAADTAQVFACAGITVAAVDSHSSVDERKRAVDGLRDGSIDVVCNVQLFTEGFDAPGIDTIIVARGVSHGTTWLQMIGRGLRSAEGKTHCTVLDLHGHCWRPGYGWPEDARTWHLDGHPMRTVEGLPTAVQCARCHGWSRGRGPCPVCGAERPAPPPPKLSKCELAERRRERQPRAGADWELWRELVTTARERGYKSQWASLRYRSKTGRWPRWGVAQVRDDTTGDET